VRASFDRGPFLAAEAVEARLVDELAYEDETEAKLVAACDGSDVIERQDYARRRSREMRAQVLRQSHGMIGLLHVGGTIKTGESIPGPEGANASGATTIKSVLKDLRERDDIRAVLVRVTSPGGSGVASDLIWRELVRTREKKPVVVSLGDVAASGGYYVAVGCAPVIAEPATITGSIGVVAGKANLRGLYDRLGITKELIQRGRHAALYSDYVPLGEEERARIQTEAQHFYDDFVDKVVAARKLTPEAVIAVAEGRVWTGRQAWTRGLVDELGGSRKRSTPSRSSPEFPPTLPWPSSGCPARGASGSSPSTCATTIKAGSGTCCSPSPTCASCCANACGRSCPSICGSISPNAGHLRPPRSRAVLRDAATPDRMHFRWTTSTR